MLRVTMSAWAATLRLWVATVRCHWLLFGGSAMVSVLLATAGLAAVGVKLPAATDAPFEVAGIELPDPSHAGDGEAVLGSTQGNQRSHGIGGQQGLLGKRNGTGPHAAGYALDPRAGAGVQGRAQAGANQGSGHGSSAAKRGNGDRNRIFNGVSDTSDNGDFHTFAKRVGAHPAVLEDFYHWDTPLTTGALQRWNQTRTRGVLSLSTAPGDGPELISPREIAQGKGDHYLIRLNHSIAGSKQSVYIRLFPEMNGAWNPYSGYRAGGAPRGRRNSTTSFRRAWQRLVLIVRGGPRREINKQLQKRGMPRILRASSNHDPVYKPADVQRRLPHPKVSFMWTPAAVSSPNVAGNQPRAYWPGKRFVDWVGTDIYSTPPGGLKRLGSFYREWSGYPFVVGEYSPWKSDRSGRFTRKLFHWAESHGRLRMLIYYRSVHAGSPYDINHWPRAQRVLRHELNKRIFAPYAPGMRP